MNGNPLISFVGAGPGASDLITIRGSHRLGEADVVIWASSLVPGDLLDHARASAEIFDSAGMTLEDVLGVYATHPAARIVRLHSGDPSLYGAIFEQIAWCIDEQRTFEIVPGVSSLAAAAARLGVELTVPKVAQSVVLTRLPGRTAASMPPRERIETFAQVGATMAIFLSGAHAPEVQDALLAQGSGYDPTTPAAVVVRASWPDETVLRCRLGDLTSSMSTIDARLTALILVGPALGAAATSDAEDPTGDPKVVAGRSHLYSPAYTHRFRRRSLPGSTKGRPRSRHRR